MFDRRKSTRTATSSPAYISSGHAKIPCTIVDVSATGARIEMQSAPFMASNCVIVSSLFDEPAKARVVWRQGTVMGVQFTGAVERSGGKAQARSGWLG